MKNKFIECNKERNFGQPTLIDRRLTVYDIVTKLFYEDEFKAALEDYQITLLEAKAAIKYCMNLSCQKDKNLIHYCDGCLLRTLEEGWNFKREDYVEIKNNDNSKITISNNGKEIFLGSIKELEDSEFGKVTWLIAKEIMAKL
jgi:uncharacterized protein (DUF433 family)